MNNATNSNSLQLTGAANLPPRQARPVELFEPGLEIVWMGRGGEIKIPAVVCQIDRLTGLVEISFVKDDVVLDGSIWERPENLRIRCVDCHFSEAMPNSQVCAGCWNWSISEDAKEVAGHAS